MSKEKKQRSAFYRFIFRPFLWIITILLVLIIITAIVLFFFLDTIIKTGIEKLGPMVAGVDMKIEEIHVKPFQGRVEIRKFTIFNPADAGYQSPHAIHLGYVNAEVDPISVIKGKKIILHEVTLKDIAVNYETDLLSSNLQDILNKINELSAQSKKEQEEGTKSAPAGLQIDSFVMDNVGVYVIVKGLAASAVGAAVTIDPIGPVGTNPEGISPFDFAFEVMNSILLDSSKQGVIKITGSLTDTADAAVDILRDSGSNVLDTTKDTGDSLKETGKNLKDSGKKALEDLKKLF